MSTDKIRYAVIGLGHIAQNAVLPAFEHASENSVITALISDDAEKIGELSHRYNVPYCYTYERFDEALAEDSFDAIYIALPNDLKLRGDKSRLPDDSLIMEFQPVAAPSLVKGEPPSQS